MKRQGVILIGAGGHALSLAEFAGGLIEGYLSNEENSSIPAERKGSDSDAQELIKKGYPFHMAFVYSGLPEMSKRRNLIERYEKSGAKFVTLVSPKAIVTENSDIGDGSAIMTGAILNRAYIGNHVIVNSGAIIEHDSRVGDNTFIGPGVVIGGFTEIGKDCFIGLGARVGNGLKIADGVSVAMGATVNRDLTEPGIYHGNPLRCFKPKTK